MSPAAEPAVRLPYPGLRSFQRDESDLFFGREGTVNDMIGRLRPNHFLAVLGTSGSGKSSLVRIGLLDGLELGLLAEAGSRWRIVDFTPGASPLRNLAQALARLSGGSDVDTDFLEAFLARGPRSVIEWCKDGHLPAGANLLLLVDQFEELFRYQDYAERQAAEAFVALLIESAKNREVPIYVVMTMRSEYLGACALIEGLAEIINDGQFLTPRLNRDQCREAILGPAAVCGTAIEEPLVNRLLNDLEDFAPWDERDSGDQLDRLVRRADQLPLLQHTLNRLWLRADAMRRGSNEPIVIRLADYDAIGGLRGAINAHADEILATLGPNLQSRAEQVFRALTDGKSLATAVRRPLRFDDLVAVCDGDEAGVRAVVDAFRQPGVNFLAPDTSRRLVADTIVDISHESLMRQWRRLSGWVIDEAREAQEWTRLGEAAARYRAGEGSRWHGQDLHQWRDRPRPTAAWAKRYNQPYDETLAFLDESIHADRRGRRLRNAAIAAAFIVVVGFGGGGFFFSQLAGKNAELEQRQTELAAANDTLEQQQSELATANTALMATSAELEANNTALVEAQAQLADSVERLQAAQQQLRDVFFRSFDASAGTYQHAGRWADAGALLGAMLNRTSHGSGPARTYDDAVVQAARMRLAEQWAFPSWPDATHSSDPADAPVAAETSPGRFGISQSEDGGPLRIVDRLTGAVVAETELPEGMGLDPVAVRYVSADGSNAVVITDTAKVLRWQVRAGRLDDYGALDGSTQAVLSVALDPASDRVAVLLFPEDSEIQVLGGDPDYSGLKAPLVGIAGMADEEAEVETSANARTLDGHDIGFWAGGLVVSFLDGDRPRFAAVDLDAVRATRLPDDLEAVMPSPDGRWLFVEAASGCALADLALVGADGGLVTLPGGPGLSRAPRCVGALGTTDGDVEVLGAFYPLDAGLPLIGDVLGLGDVDGEHRYRLVLDGSVGDAAEPSLFAIDLAERDGRLVRVSSSESSDDAAAADVPLPVKHDDGPIQFVRPSTVDAWRPLPAYTPVKTVTWFDSVSETTMRLAEILASEEGAGSLAARPLATQWPSEELGFFAEIKVASGGDAILVVAADQGGIQRLEDGAPELMLRDLNVGNECRLPSGESLKVTRLVSWDANTPTFLGLDASGRVLRLSLLLGGGSSASSGAGVFVNCIGRLRPDFQPIVLADPAGERVLLQTDPAGYAVLPASIETEKEFNEAQRITLQTPSHRAALVGNALASVDRSGSLSVLRFRADGCTGADSPVAEGGAWCEVGSRTVVVPAPTDMTATGDRLLVVGDGGRAVVVDLSADDPVPVAAGVVPQSSTGYRLLPGGSTVEILLAGAVWQVPLPALPDLDRLARFAEAAAGALTDSSDLDQVSLGRRLTRSDGEAMAGIEATDMDLGSDARCYLAAHAVVEAWKAEAGQGAPGTRLATANREAEAQCAGAGALAAVGRRLAATSHFLSPALDPWPEEWSMLLGDSIAGNRLASRAMLVGLANSTDVFARAAGDWFARSRAAVGLELPESVFQDAAAGKAIDPALRAVVEEQRESYEPAIHELLGHIAARGGDQSRLREAWVHFRLAEILYGHQFGRDAEAARTAEFRAPLSRALSADELLAAWREAGEWTANIDAMPTAVPPTSERGPRERMRADAERLAALVARGDGDAPYRMPPGYLWLNLADLEASVAPADAVESYTRFIELMTSLPTSELPPASASTLAEVWLKLVDLAAANRPGDRGAVAELAPFVLGLAEPDEEGVWDETALRTYASIVAAVTTVVTSQPDAVPGTVLEALRFAERRFGHNFRIDSDDLREAATLALEGRLALLDSLLERDPERWDWLAAKGTTEFWIGYRLNEAGDGRAEWLARAIRDFSAAKAAAADELPPESLYWLTEARRWFPPGGDPSTYLELTADGIGDYEILREAQAGGAWQAPISLAELLASNTELLAKIADAQARLVAGRGDDWSPSDPAVQEQVLEGLYTIAEWDRIRSLAVEAGSNWESMAPGLVVAPGYLLGAVGGHFNLARAEADDCDRAASSVGDPMRRASAVALADIDADTAIDACMELLDEDDIDPRLNFLVGRLLWSGEDRLGSGLDAVLAAADGDYAVAFDGLAEYLKAAGQSVPDGYALQLDMRFGYAQRVVAAVYDDVHAWLAPLASTEKDHAGLRWLNERAAALGSADAHVVLAGLPDTSDEDRYYHLEVAALMLEEEGDDISAEDLRTEIPPEYKVDAADRAEDEYRVERLVAVPPDLADLLRGATN